MGTIEPITNACIYVCAQHHFHSILETETETNIDIRNEYICIFIHNTLISIRCYSSSSLLKRRLKRSCISMVSKMEWKWWPCSHCSFCSVHCIPLYSIPFCSFPLRIKYVECHLRYLVCDQSTVFPIVYTILTE